MRRFAEAPLPIDGGLSARCGRDEVGVDPASGAALVRVDPLPRPTEVQTLLGDASKTREKLGCPTVPFSELVTEMVASDLTRLTSPDHVRRAATD